MGVLRVAVLTGVVAVAALGAHAATQPRPAHALHATASCGTLAGYKLKARNVGCRFTRRWAPRSFYNRRRPAGWRCNYGSSRSSVRMFCFSGSKAYFMQR